MEQNKIQVGKYTLESLTTGMYSDPKIIYREYIQNSVDSLENAVLNKVIEMYSMRIDIVVNSEESYISIRDNGTGIPSGEAISTLMSIGNSKKKHSNNRGFRGIGRLGGMSYCDTLIFSTSSENEDIKTIVTFDCKKLRQLLVPGANEDLDLAAVMETVTTTEKLKEKRDKHYFIVEMKGVNSFSDLLNIDVVRSYISQVAPLPYKTRQFVYGNYLHKQLFEKGYELEGFPIFVGENEYDLEPVYKPNRHRYHADRNKKKNDEILNFELFEVVIEDELYALGWYGDCNWYGSLSEQEISGIRVRKGNILIGDNKTMNIIFREARFNGWTQGEIFIVTDKLIPNARRDDFEQNSAYFKLITALQDGVGYEITRKIREASNSRNDSSAKKLNEVQRQLVNAAKVTEEGFNSSTDKNRLIENLEKAEEVLKKTKVKPELQMRKDDLQKEISNRIDKISESNNYKINQINSSIDKKSKKVLTIVSDILSQKLAKPLVDDIIEEIIKSMNRK